MTSMFWKKIKQPLILIFVWTVTTTWAGTSLPTLKDYADSTTGVFLKCPVGWENPRYPLGFAFRKQSDWYKGSEYLYCAQRPPVGSEVDALPGSPCRDIPEQILLVRFSHPPVSKNGDCFNSYIHALEKAYTRSVFHFVESGDLKGSRIPGKYLIYTYEPGDCGGSMKCLTFFYVRKKGVYALTCTSCPERFKNYSKFFSEIGTSFEAN